MIEKIEQINFPQYISLVTADISLLNMGERTITSQVKIDGSVTPNFVGTDGKPLSVRFMGEKYVLKSYYPQALKDNTSMMSVVDLTFHHWAEVELQRYFFIDMASTESGTAKQDNYETSMSLNATDFVKALNNVLTYYFSGKIIARLSEDADVSNDVVFVKISYTFIWDLLKSMHKNYGLRWTMETEGDVCVINLGFAATEVGHVFEYGFEGGLLSIERQIQGDDIRNIILGRGSDKNLPYRYFKDIDPDNPSWRADPDWIPELADMYFDGLRDATFRSYVQGWKARHYGGMVTQEQAYVKWAWQKGYTDAKFDAFVEYVTDEITINPTDGDRQVAITPSYSPYIKKGSSIDKYGPRWDGLEKNDEIFPTFQGIVRDGIGRVDEVVAVQEIEEDKTESEEKAPVYLGDVFRILFTEDAQPKQITTIRTYGQEVTVPEGYIANIVFDSVKLSARRPFGSDDYNDYSNYIVVKSSRTVRYDNDGKKWVSAAGLEAGTYAVAVEIEIENTYKYKLEVSGGVKNAKVKFADSEIPLWNTFDIWIKNIWNTTKGDDISDEQYVEEVWGPILGDRNEQEAAVSFSTGWLANDDYSFKLPINIKTAVHYDTSKSIDGVPSHWRLTLVKSDAELDTLGVLIPSTTMNARAGDHFFFTGIDVPYMYYTAAEIRLTIYKQQYLEQVKDIKPTWVIKLSKTRVSEKQEGETAALIEQIKPGVVLNLADKRFITGAPEQLYVTSVTYSYKEPNQNDPYIVPDIEIVLSDKVTEDSTASTIQGDIEAVKQQVLGLSSSVTIITDTYLHKDRNDTTPYHLTMGSGQTMYDFIVGGKLTIGGCVIEWDPENEGLRFRKGIYSDSYVSALGLGGTGSTAGAGALAELSDVLLDNPVNGQALVYDGTHWVNQSIATGLDTAQLAAYLTTNNYAKKSDIPSLSGYATEQWVLNKSYATQQWVEGKGYLTAVAWGDVSGKPTWIGATKPNYNFSEIGSKPTTLAGYGITDAKIDGGVITLGANTITPLVASDMKTLTFAAGSFTAKSYTPTAAQTVNIPTSTSHIAEGTRLYFTDARAQAALASTVSDLNAAIGTKLPTVTFDSFKNDYDTWKSGIDTFKAAFESMFVKESDGNGGWRIKANYGLYSVDFVSTLGLSAGGNGGGGGASYDRLDAWSDYVSDKAGWVLSAALGYDLYQSKASSADLTALTARVASLEVGSVLSVTTTGTGNAITSISKSGTAITATKGSTFLTSHQSLYTLTIQKNGTQVGTFKPNADATINISDVASAATLSSHTGNSTIHITADERTLWNTTASNLSAILGSDADNVINKWDEIVAFLDTYTEADTLANLLSNKADKATKVSAGTGLTGGGSLAADRTLSLATSGVTAGTYTKLTVDAYGRATGGASLVAADIPSLDWSKITTGKPTTLLGYGITDAYTKTDADNRYVNVTGDTMSGTLTIGIDTASVNHLAFSRASWNYISATAKGGMLVFITDGTSPSSTSGTLYLEGKNGRPGLNNTSSWGTSSQRWSNVYSVLGTFSGQVTAGSLKIGDCEITWDAANNSLKFSKGIYSESNVSALGLSNTSSGGTGGGLIQNVYGWNNLGGTFDNGTLTDTFNAYTINKLYNDKADKSWVEAKGYLTGITKAQVEAVLTGTITSHKHTSIASLGQKNPQTGRTQAYGNLYTYNTSATAHEGAPTTYTSVIGFGLGTGGTIEIAGGWTSSRGLWHRALRDTTDEWFGWIKVLDASNTYISDGAIVINGSSITPLVAHQSLAAYLKIDGSNGTANGVSALLNKLTESTAVPVDGDFYISQYAGGGTVTTSYHRRPMSALWNYIKSKADAQYQPKGPYVSIGSDGVSEVGRYIDFHSDNYGTNTKEDYTVRLNGGTGVKRIFAFPTTGGTIATESWVEGKGYLAASSYTAADILSKLKTVDGEGSGLDADTLDGWHGVGTSGKVIRKSGFLVSNTASLSSYWGKVASWTWGAKGNDRDITLYMHSVFQEVRGIVSIRARWESATAVAVSAVIVAGNLSKNALRLYYDKSAVTGALELWYNVGGIYGCLNTYVLSETARYGAETDIVTLHNNNFTAAQTPTLTEYVSGSYLSLGNNAASATKLLTPRSLWGQSFDGSGNVSGLLTATVASSHSGIKLGNAYLTAISGQVILQNLTELRFGSSDVWAYNDWAGIKYDTGNKHLYIGFPDGTVFNNSGTASAGPLTLSGVTELNTRNILPQADESYDIGENGGSFRYGYFSWIGSQLARPLEIGADDNTHIYINTDGQVGVGLSVPNYLLDVNGDAQIRGWLRTTGDKGWRSETYGGGWYMSDNTWIRSFGSKSLYMGTSTIRTDGEIHIGPNGGKILMTAAGVLKAAGEIKSFSANAFRACYGNYGVFFRNDGANFYTLLTNSGEAESGSYNSLRPFYINLASGMVTMSSGVTLYNSLKANCDIIMSAGHTLRIGDGILEWDSANNSIKVRKADGGVANFYATGGVSSLGFSSGSNGTATIDALNMNYGFISNCCGINGDGDELYLGNTGNDSYVRIVEDMTGYYYDEQEETWKITVGGDGTFNNLHVNNGLYVGNALLTFASNTLYVTIAGTKYKVNLTAV